MTIRLTVLSLASIGPMLAFGPFRWGPGSARPNTLSWARAFLGYSASRGFARRATPGGGQHYCQCNSLGRMR
ncbi:hypothetical protein T492DRAFT_1031721 [Pavlovales sp. CCMP2436]|nr:hypothetical protein T492DRAFT_1031721 [Pavlovales sp. CCMP2436]